MQVIFFSKGIMLNNLKDSLNESRQFIIKILPFSNNFKNPLYTFFLQVT